MIVRSFLNTRKSYKIARENTFEFPGLHHPSRNTLKPLKVVVRNTFSGSDPEVTFESLLRITAATSCVAYRPLISFFPPVASASPAGVPRIASLLANLCISARPRGLASHDSPFLHLLSSTWIVHMRHLDPMFDSTSNLITALLILADSNAVVRIDLFIVSW